MQSFWDKKGLFNFRNKRDTGKCVVAVKENTPLNYQYQKKKINTIY